MVVTFVISVWMVVIFGPQGSIVSPKTMIGQNATEPQKGIPYKIRVEEKETRLIYDYWSSVGSDLTTKLMIFHIQSQIFFSIPSQGGTNIPRGLSVITIFGAVS